MYNILHFTSEDQANRDQERIEELFRVEIDSLKDDVVKAEREVSDLKKDICKKRRNHYYVANTM